MSLSNKIDLKTGDKIRITKIFYPISIDNLGRTSIIEVSDDFIYLVDLKIYINSDCVEKIENDSVDIYIDPSNKIYEPIVMGITDVKIQ